MKEYVCQRCKQIKEEKEFWKVYKDHLIDEISDKTKTLVNYRGNIQRYCKKCCRSWFNDNKWRQREYTQRYNMKLKERKQVERRVEE